MWTPIETVIIHLIKLAQHRINLNLLLLKRLFGFSLKTMFTLIHKSLKRKEESNNHNQFIEEKCKSTSKGLFPLNYVLVHRGLN